MVKYQSVDEKPKNKSSRIISKKFVIPEFIKMTFDNLDESITSMWGMQTNGKIKWKAKYNQWEAFRSWFMEMSK